MYQEIIAQWHAGGAALEALEGDSSDSLSTLPTLPLAYVAQAIGFLALFSAVFSPLL